MSSRAARSVVVVFVALVLAALAVFFVPTEEAEGRAPGTVNREAYRVLDTSTKDLGSSDPARAARARAAYARAYPKAVPRLAPYLIRGGPAGALALAGGGIWYHNYMTLKTGLEGAPDTVIRVEQKFAPHANSKYARAFWLTSPDPNYSGKPAVSVFITGLRWRVHPDGKYEGALSVARETSTIKSYGPASDGTYEGYWGPEPSVGFTRPNGCTGSSYPNGFAPAWISVGVSSSYELPPRGTYSCSGYYPPANSDVILQGRKADGSYEPVQTAFDDLCTTPGCSLDVEVPVYQVGAGKRVSPEAVPPPGDFVTTPEESQAVADGLVADPEYDPSWAKPWLREGFRAPSDPREREALWGTVIGTYSTLDDGNCKIFESGAQLCDYADGTAYVWIENDWTAWMQHPDGSKEWLSQPGDRPPSDPEPTLPPSDYQGPPEVWVYEPNPKHNPYFIGRIGREPSNGMKALEGSVAVKDKAGRDKVGHRVYVDREAGEWVILRGDNIEVRNGVATRVWHGYVPNTWRGKDDGARQNERNAMYRAKMVKDIKTGRIP